MESAVASSSNVFMLLLLRASLRHRASRSPATFRIPPAQPRAPCNPMHSCMKKLAGKVALITGAGSGLGAAAARLLAEEGARVGLLSRTASELEKLEHEIVAAGGEAMALPADISKP